MTTAQRIRRLLLIAAALTWLAVSFRYGPDPDTPPAVRYTAIAAASLLMIGLLIWKWRKRSRTSHR